ncbi:uncharacterized protein LOC133789481 [Humulus lupulus]|uniref:uncharacterized protein LOC133789481 n=1 Tax=Humulus lupulus TaxID=3486 RepID=UPI002B415D5A|nr:uncharacterized protein LOC133789481 [Humulus lupulus]
MAAITGAAAAAYSVISLRSRSPQLHHIAFQKITSKKDYGLKSASLSVKFRISSYNFGSQPPRAIVLRVSCSGIEERVTKIIVEQLGVLESEVVNTASFVEDLGSDSLDLAELIMALEEEFDTEIPDEEAEKIRTVQAAIDYITSHQA